MRTPRRYRVFRFAPGARSGGAGHPLHASRLQGAGRVDNPGHYRTLYASDSPVGAVAEAFGNHAIWTTQLLQGRALAAFEADKVDALDLDDARELARRRLRPSAVVTRDRTVTQHWALEIFDEKRWAGVRWWSYHVPRRGSFGLWNLAKLRLLEVVRLTPAHPAFREAAAVLARPWKDVP